MNGLDKKIQQTTNTEEPASLPDVHKIAYGLVGLAIGLRMSFEGTR